MIATLWEVWNDRNGDLNKASDVIIRCLLFVVETLILHYTFKKPVIDCYILTVAVFFFLFDYAVHIAMIRTGTLELPRHLNWFTYIGKSAVFDRIIIWNRIGGWGRFLVKSLVLIGATILFYL